TSNQCWNFYLSARFHFLSCLTSSSAASDAALACLFYCYLCRRPGAAAAKAARATLAALHWNLVNLLDAATLYNALRTLAARNTLASTTEGEAGARVTV